MQTARGWQRTFVDATLLLALGLSPGAVQADWRDWVDDLTSSVTRGSDDATLEAGLREALEVSARRATAQTSRPDGFWGDPRIRIPVPDELEMVTRGLRGVGMGAEVDRLERGMNRAAEEASGEAFDVFAASIAQMSFADAQTILGGGDTAATEYFQRTTSDELRQRFEPIVDRSMQDVGLVEAYDGVLAQWRRVPLAPEPDLDLRSYVTERGLDGLFDVLGREEAKIRADPAARTSELLQTVFGER